MTDVFSTWNMSSGEDLRPSGEEMLDRVRRQAGAGARGRHRVYLGMAPGVGKTYTALEELQRRKQRGTDVVIGFLETHGRRKTAALASGLEVIPRHRIPYRGVTVDEMDTEALIARAPAVALVDEIAHANAPGCKHDKRWQDVEDLLDAGVTVISTVNLLHLESMADIVENITGSQVRERMPDRIVDRADEVELIDMTPESLRERLRQGDIYTPDHVERAMGGFFRESNLLSLRELALRKMAQVCEVELEVYTRQRGIENAWSAGERVMVCIDEQPRAQHLTRRAWRMAERYQTDLLAVFVESPGWAHASPEQKRALEENLRFAEDLGAEPIRLRARDVAAELTRVAREKNAGSIVIGQSHHRRLLDLLHGSVVRRLLRLASDVDVHVVAEREDSAR